VTSVTDGHGDEIAIYEYDSFGNVLTEAGSLANEFKFSTKQADKRGQFIDFGFRWYDPDVGRFTQRDPIGVAGGLNLYEYCYGNPVNLLDPWGLYWLCGGRVGLCPARVGLLETVEDYALGIGLGVLSGATDAMKRGESIGTGAIAGGIGGGVAAAVTQVFSGLPASFGGYATLGGAAAGTGYVVATLLTGGDLSVREVVVTVALGGLSGGVAGVVPGGAMGLGVGGIVSGIITGSLGALANEAGLIDGDKRDQELACRIQNSGEDDYGPTTDWLDVDNNSVGNRNYIINEYGVSPGPWGKRRR
jgi:RHS repeat-associated protein